MNNTKSPLLGEQEKKFYLLLFLFIIFMNKNIVGDIVLKYSYIS